ncbi:MAG: hypothetical protein M1832_001022 [Thelocarpon impressellum]|nr:MAG: hypothetical protein M1832_001022 [Thelocarpon impressellum]
MRLYLTVHRHGLPTAAVLWTIGSSGPTSAASGRPDSIAQLLERINDTIPLEAGEWGLEDYVVEVQGFECLHYEDVKGVLQDGDSVKKKRRLAYGDENTQEVTSTSRGRQSLIAAGFELLGAGEDEDEDEDEDDDDDDEDEDFEPGKSVTSIENGLGRVEAVGSDSSIGDSEEFAGFHEDLRDEAAQELARLSPPSERGSNGPSPTRKRRRLDHPAEDGGTSHDAGEKRDSDTMGLGGKERIHFASESEGSGRDESDEDETCDFRDDTSSSGESEATTDGEDVSSTSDSSSSALSSSDESTSDSDEEEVSAPHGKEMERARLPEQRGVLKSHPKQLRPKTTPPGQGMIATKKRNERRRAMKRMDHLKRIVAATRTKTERKKPKNKHVAGSTSPGGQDGTAINDDFEARRRDLLAAIASGGIEIGPPETGLSQAGDIETSDEAQGGWDSAAREIEHASAVTDSSGATPPAKRKKLDVASSMRLLYGALGVRAPKSKDDEARVRQDLTKNIRVAKAAPPHGHGPDEGGSAAYDLSDESWKEKLIVSAVECVDEDVQLTAPPFPFTQRWDPQQNALAWRPRDGKKRNRNKRDYCEGGKPERYDPHWHGQRDFLGTQSRLKKTEVEVELDYDEPEAPTGPELGPATAPKDDLPALPEDMASCDALKEADARPGMVIAFKQLIMTADWQPSVSDYRTAVVDSILDGGKHLRMTLAKRDRPAKEKIYDEQTGERVYGKFEMPDPDADEGDDGRLEQKFVELGDPKIIRAPASGAEGPVTATNGTTLPADMVDGAKTLQKQAGTNGVSTITHITEIHGPNGDAAHRFSLATSLQATSLGESEAQKPESPANGTLSEAGAGSTNGAVLSPGTI